MVEEARAMVVARRIHGEQTGAHQQKHSEGQKAVEALKDGRDASRERGLVEHG